MLRTAGLCTTSETRHPKRERYAKIEISLKVCDSAGDGSFTAVLSIFDTEPVKLLLAGSLCQFELPFLGERTYCVLFGGC